MSIFLRRPQNIFQSGLTYTNIEMQSWTAVIGLAAFSSLTPSLSSLPLHMKVRS